MTTTTKTTTTTTKTADKQHVEDTEAVRAYLEFRQNPESALNTKAIAVKEQELEDASGIDKLRVHAELLRLRDTEGAEEGLLRDFIRVAQRWADREGIGAVSFREMWDIPPSVLKEAGFSVGRKSKGSRGRKNVSSETVRQAVPRVGTFTIKALAEESGGSVANARLVVKAMVEDADVVDLGPDPDFTGKGATPVLYKRV
jgi:hypothetical protein